MEIQRLIGRALRTVVDLEALGERTVWIDCDVIQADGGTRTASITGAFIAVALAVEKGLARKQFKKMPLTDFLAATSVGIDNDGIAILDLCYKEDSSAQVDMNIVMTGNGEFVELQGTGEKATFNMNQLNEMLALGKEGIETLIEKQKEAIGEFATKIKGGSTDHA